MQFNKIIIRFVLATSVCASHLALATNYKREEFKKASVIQRQARLQHAQELLGRHYKRSAVRNGERIQKINSKIYMYARERLPKAHRQHYKKVAQAIIDESLKYEFDPVFLLSVIQGESSFNPRQLGKLDEIGLMQIRPATAEWICKMFGMSWKGDKSLFDPVTNIRIGAAYLSFLRQRFDSHAQLYLAAYNMGQGNVDQLLKRDVWPKEYPTHVMRFYVEFYTSMDLRAGRATANAQVRPERS